MAGIAAALRQHELVGLDTPAFIYHLEGTSRYAAAAEEVFGELANGVFQGVTSVLTLMELLVKPLQLSRPDIADECEIILVSYPHLTGVPLDRDAARRAAELRAEHRLRAADALQLAACFLAGATAFVTNDAALRRVAELQVILLGDFAPD